jgi:uncharacterized membrane protein
MDERLAMMLINIPIIFTLLFIGYITPALTRKELYFGVRIPNDHLDDEELKKFRVQYNKNFTLTCGVYSILLIVVLYFTQNPLVFTAGFLILTLLLFLNFFYTHKKVRDFKKLKNWSEGIKQVVVVDTSFRTSKDKKIVVSSLWFVVPAVIAIANAVVSITLYDTLPDRIPTHWNIQGQVDAWEEKSLASVLQMPIMQMFITGVMFFSYKMAERSKQQISSRNPELSKEQNRLFRLRWSGYTVVLNIAIVMLFTIVNFTSLNILKISSKTMIVIMLILIGFSLIGSIFMSLWTGQGGSRIKIKDKSEKNEDYNDREDDDHWKLGTFYFNPNDPALFIEKRWGVGWTINFGRPIAVVIFAAIILGAILIPLILSMLS